MLYASIRHFVGVPSDFYRLILVLMCLVIDVGQVESLQSSLNTATGRVNQLQRANELLEAQLKSLKVVIDTERRQAASATDGKKLSAERDLEVKRQFDEISQLKQQVTSRATIELSSMVFIFIFVRRKTVEINTFCNKTCKPRLHSFTFYSSY